MERAITFELRIQRLSTVIVVRLFSPFRPPYFIPDPVIRSLLLALRVRPVDKTLFLRNQQRPRVSCLAMDMYIVYIAPLEAHIRCSLCSRSSPLPVYCL